MASALKCSTSRRRYRVNEPIEVRVSGLSAGEERVSYRFALADARGERVAVGAGIVPAVARGAVALFAPNAQPFAATPGQYKLRVEARGKVSRRSRFDLPIRVVVGGQFRRPRAELTSARRAAP